MEYIDQLAEYGFSKDETTSAWEIDQKDNGHGSSDANE